MGFHVSLGSGSIQKNDIRQLTCDAVVELDADLCHLD